MKSWNSGRRRGVFSSVRNKGSDGFELVRGVVVGWVLLDCGSLFLVWRVFALFFADPGSVCDRLGVIKLGLRCGLMRAELLACGFCVMRKIERIREDLHLFSISHDGSFINVVFGVNARTNVLQAFYRPL